MVERREAVVLHDSIGELLDVHLLKRLCELVKELPLSTLLKANVYVFVLEQGPLTANDVLQSVAEYKGQPAQPGAEEVIFGGKLCQAVSHAGLANLLVSLNCLLEVAKLRRQEGNFDVTLVCRSWG